MVSADGLRVRLNVSVEGHRSKRRSYVRDVHSMASPSLGCHFVWGLADQSLRRAEARQVVSRQVRGSLAALSSPPNQSGITEEMASRLCHGELHRGGFTVSVPNDFHENMQTLRCRSS